MIIRVLAVATALTRCLAAQAAHLPSAFPLFVLQGGDTPNVNYHMAAPSQAFAVDFGVVGGPTGRELARASGSRAEDFYCWDTPVISPVTGRVVTVVDSLPDNILGVKDSVRPLGNHVIIQEGDRYFYLAHLRRRSATVRAGDPVTVAQPIGRCGNSGNTDFPHIHLHATHSPRFGAGFGINLIFGPMNVDLAGKQFQNVEWPLLRGLWLSSR